MNGLNISDENEWELLFKVYQGMIGVKGVWGKLLSIGWVNIKTGNKVSEILLDI